MCSVEYLEFKGFGGLDLGIRVDSKLFRVYRGTSLIRNSAPLELYRRKMPRNLWWSLGGGLSLMSEVPL